MEVGQKISFVCDLYSENEEGQLNTGEGIILEKKEHDSVVKITDIYIGNSDLIGNDVYMYDEEITIMLEDKDKYKPRKLKYNADQHRTDKSNE
tara:strand:- start:603 stop:881 length:279 start_codon:yes stop_codon:yes gene_type:complete